MELIASKCISEKRKNGITSFRIINPNTSENFIDLLIREIVKKIYM